MIRIRRIFIVWGFLFVVMFLLLGCSTTVPVRAKFPTAPDRLMQQCLPLDKLENEPKLSDITKTVTKNYNTYYECAVKHDTFVEWYQKQKQIFESVK